MKDDDDDDVEGVNADDNDDRGMQSSILFLSQSDSDRVLHEKKTKTQP